MRRLATRLLVVPVVVASWAPCETTAADTIYLVNGRKIHTESARIRDGWVVFEQLGGTVSIPLDQVVRIVVDDEAEEPIIRSTPTTDRGATADTVGHVSPGSDTGPATAASGSVPTDGTGNAAGEGMSAPKYWIDRINAVDARIKRVQTELDRLPLYSAADQRLFRFSGQIRYFIAEREKWERLMSGMQLHRRQLLRGARKAGVTPGALRDGLAKR